MKKTLLAILLAAAGVAQAAFLDGNELLRMMRGSADDRAIAIGYVTGVTDAVKTPQICTPDSATAGQVHDVVRKFLVDEPQHRAASADVIVRAALMVAWPCKSKPSASQPTKLL